MRKNFGQKVFLYFVYKLLGCSINLWKEFFQNINLKVCADWYSSNSFIAGVVDTEEIKKIAGVVLNGDKLIAGVACEYENTRHHEWSSVIEPHTAA